MPTLEPASTTQATSRNTSVPRGIPAASFSITTIPEIFIPAKALKAKHYRAGDQMHQITSASATVVFFSRKAGVRH
jgi:hypothetical protein